MNEVMARSIKSFPPTFPHFTEEQYYNPRYIFIPPKATAVFWESVCAFSTDELKSKVETSKQCKLERYLERMSMDFERRPEPMVSMGDYNPINGRPLIKMGQQYLLPLPSLLWRAISNTFHYDFLADASYRGRYISIKGEVAENRAKKCLAKIFRNDEIRTRVRYSKDEGWPDADILIDDDEATVLIECTSKWINQESKKGFLESITKDLHQSVEKCFKQLVRAQSAICDGQIKTKTTRKIIPIIIVDDPIPNLDSILYYSNFLGEQRPYIISTYELDIIADFTDKKDFINFVSQRIEVSKKGVMFCSDELDYFVFYKLRGFENYIDKIKENMSVLHYIGHIEQLDPTYYGKKLREFINDYQLEALLGTENLELLEGWS
jgi:hypothetical protein